MALGQFPARDSGRSSHKFGMVCVDVSGLDTDETADVFRCGSEPFTEQFRDRFDELGMHVRETRELLL
jgi:hypothetical protein